MSGIDSPHCDISDTFMSDLLLSAAPVESHVGAIVDSPNACVTLSLPLGIFENVRVPVTYILLPELTLTLFIAGHYAEGGRSQEGQLRPMRYS